MISVVTVGDPRLEAVSALFREYNDYLGFDLRFQGFEEELAALPGKYGAPSGRLYLAELDGEMAGCAAFYQQADGICELKRLYVRDAFKGRGLGRALMERAMADAKAAGYRAMRLDSLERLKDARPLYDKLGFHEIPPFNECPLEDVYYMERAL